MSPFELPFLFLCPRTVICVSSSSKAQLVWFHAVKINVECGVVFFSFLESGGINQVCSGSFPSECES